jgi:hypothetical protein
VKAYIWNKSSVDEVESVYQSLVMLFGVFGAYPSRRPSKKRVMKKVERPVI